MEQQFTIDSQPLLTESQYDNTQRQEDLDTIPEENPHTLDSSNRSEIFTEDSSFDRWAAGEPSIGSTEPESVDHGSSSTVAQNPERKYEGMSTPDREDCLRIEKIFEEEQQKEKEMADKLENWKGKYVAVERNNFNIIELGLIKDVDKTTQPPILHLHTQDTYALQKLPQQLPVSHILNAELMPFPHEFLNKVFDSYEQAITIICKHTTPYYGICNGIRKGELKDYTGQHYILELLINLIARNDPDTLEMPLDSILHICTAETPAWQIRIINTAYKLKDKMVELVTDQGIVHHGQCLGIYELSRENKEDTEYKVQIIMMDHQDSTWKQSLFPVEKVRYIKERPKHDFRRKELQNCLNKRVELIYETEHGTQIAKGLLQTITDEFGSENDYIEIQPQIAPDKYDTTNILSIYLKEIKVVSYGPDVYAPISISKIWSHQNEKVRITLKDGTQYDGLCFEPKRIELDDDDFMYVVIFITIDYRRRMFYRKEIDIETIKTISDITPYLQTREQLTLLTGKRATLMFEEKENVAEITGTILGFVLDQDKPMADEVLIDEHGECSPRKPGWKGRSIKINKVYKVTPEETVTQESEEMHLHISDDSDSTKEDEDPPKVHKAEKTDTPTRMRSPMAQTTTATSPKVHKRTAQGWKEDPTSPIPTYADKAKRAKHPLDIIFQYTPLGQTFPTETKKEMEKKKWINEFNEAIKKENERAHHSSEWPDFIHALHRSLKAIGIEVNRPILRNQFKYIDEHITQNQNALDTIWNFVEDFFEEKQNEEDPPEDPPQPKQQWMDRISKEFDAELDKAIRENQQADYRYALTQAFKKNGDDINPTWLKRFQIDENTAEDYAKLDQIWETVQRHLAQEHDIKVANRLGKCQWATQLAHAMAYEEHRARLSGEHIDYRAAVLYSLAESGRQITPDRLIGLEMKLQNPLFQKDNKTIDTIWERACLELDHEYIVIQGRASNKRDQKPLKMDRRTRWERKLKELTYSELKKNRKSRGEINHAKIIQEAFTDIGWTFPKNTFQQLKITDRFGLLDKQIQATLWHTARELRDKGNLTVSYSEFPAEVLKREWTEALKNFCHQEETKERYMGAPHVDYIQVIVHAFTEIAWFVPYKDFTSLHIKSKRDLFDPTTLKHIWFTGCAAMNKPREFYLESGRDPIMSPDFEKELTGFRKYTELPITAEDKVDKIQLNFDYQRTIEQHQLSFTDWMDKTGITKLMQRGNYEMDEPGILKQITDSGYKDYLLQTWMMDYQDIQLNFETWYQYVGKTLRMPKQTSTAQAYPDPTGIPSLQDHTQHYQKVQKRTVCNLQTPPEVTSSKEEKDVKPTPFSWAKDVEQHIPLPEDERENTTQSHFTNEPAIMSKEGKFLNKQQRQEFYLKHDEDMRQTIKEEAEEKAKEHALLPEQYKTQVQSMAVKLPPMNRTTWQLEAIKANTILDQRVEVPWVEPCHFLPKGKFAHVYIPKYVHIPTTVFKKVNIHLEKHTTSYIAFHRHLREARKEANRMIQTEHLKSTHKTDYRKMLKNQTPKTITTSKIDIVQHKYAHIEAERIGWKNMKQADIYDWFIRPIERFFAIDMPQGAALLRAMLYPQSAHKLTHFIKLYTGIPRTAPLTHHFVIEEMSRIRMAYEAEFIQNRPEDTPMTRIPKIRLEEDPSGTCYVKMTHQPNISDIEEEDEDQELQQSRYEQEVATWDNIMADYEAAMTVPQQYGPAHTARIQQLLKKTHKEAKKLLNKCRQQYLKLTQQTNQPQPEQKQVVTVALTRREQTPPRQRTPSPTSSSEEEKDETNLEQMFSQKLNIRKRCVRDIINNPKLLRTPQERQKYQDVEYYKKAVDDAQIDLIRCDPEDTEFIDVLSRARDNCNKAYHLACEELQKLLNQEDYKSSNNIKKKGYVHDARQKTANQEEAREAPSKEDNAILETGSSLRPNPRARPTAWPTAQQIRNQNPYRANRIYGTPKVMADYPTENRSPNLKNTRFDNKPSGKTGDYEEKSPPNLKRNFKYDPNFSKMDTPSSESFATNATITSTPTKKRQRKEEDEEPIRAMAIQPPRSTSTSRYPDRDFYGERRHTDISPTRQLRTRQRSPSPPWPRNTKFVRQRSPTPTRTTDQRRRGNSRSLSPRTRPERKKAPNGSHLFHYKLWKQADLSILPDFTKQKMSAKEVKHYITGTRNNEDTIRHGLETFGAHGNEVERRIQLRTEPRNRCINITEILHLPNTPMGQSYTHQTIYIPEHAINAFQQLIHDIYNALVQPLEQDQHTSGTLTMYRARNKDWKAKASIGLQKTARGMERMVTFVSRSPAFEHGFFQIPWMLLEKLVQAYARTKEAYEYEKRKQDDPNY